MPVIWLIVTIAMTAFAAAKAGMSHSNATNANSASGTTGWRAPVGTAYYVDPRIFLIKEQFVKGLVITKDELIKIANGEVLGSTLCLTYRDFLGKVADKILSYPNPSGLITTREYLIEMLTQAQDGATQIDHLADALLLVEGDSLAARGARIDLIKTYLLEDVVASVKAYGAANSTTYNSHKAKFFGVPDAYELFKQAAGAV
jgi:hypothetical protein